jgi:ERCC4-type nuclease
MLVDDREKNYHILNKLKELGVEYRLERLEVGDFSFGNYILERKSINDLLNSSFTGRIYTQLENMVHNLSLGAERAILLIHGNLKEINKRYYSEADLYSCIGQLLVEYANVNIIFLPNDTAVANTLASLYFKTYQPTQPRHNWVRVPKNSTNTAMNVLRSTKVLTTRQSKEILRHFSLEEIFNLPEKDLKAIRYIGETTAKKFIQLRKHKQGG